MRQREDIAALVGQKLWRADTARRIMDAFDESGLRARAFSELYGFNEKRISAWKLRFGLRERGKARSPTDVDQSPTQKRPRSNKGELRIVPVRVRAAAAAADPAQSAEASHMIEVQTPGGCVLRVPSAFNERAIERMLMLLGVERC